VPDNEARHEPEDGIGYKPVFRHGKIAAAAVRFEFEDPVAAKGQVGICNSSNQPLGGLQLLDLEGNGISSFIGFPPGNLAAGPVRGLLQPEARH